MGGKRVEVTEEVRLERRERHKQWSDNYYKTNWKRRLTVLLGAAKSRQKILDADGNRKSYVPSCRVPCEATITLQELHDQLVAQNYKCYYTGDELVLDPQNKHKAIGLDRVDSSKGYVVGNVVFTMWCINRAKSDMTHDDFLAMCKSVVAHHS